MRAFDQEILENEIAFAALKRSATMSMAREMARSIVDMIMEQDDQHQGPLLAETISNLGDEYLQRRGLIPTGRHDH
jgi:hypothetical protein